VHVETAGRLRVAVRQANYRRSACRLRPLRPPQRLGAPNSLVRAADSGMTDDSITFGLVTRPDLAHARKLLDELAATAIFSAFALRMPR